MTSPSPADRQSPTPRVEPLLVFDPLLVEAARRAFQDLAGRISTGDLGGIAERIAALGFDEALPNPVLGDGWADAAIILRAQAHAGIPVDMAAWLMLDDRALATRVRPHAYRLEFPDWLADADETARLSMSLARCLQITGAIEAAIDLALRYVQDRHQFGRPLAKFQAVQQQLAVAAEEAAAAITATDFALATVIRRGLLDESATPLIMAASLVTGHAVTVCNDITHQVHGAMGFTREYPLHRHSLDMLRWRDELLYAQHGEMRCAEAIGDRVIEAGGLWHFITSTMRP